MSASPRSQRGWKQDPEGRRDRILAAATAEFGSRGYERTRVDRIARSADVAEGTVYHRFGSKRGLLAAVGERYGEELVRAAFDAAEPGSEPDDAARVIGNIFAFVGETHVRFGAFVLAHQPGEAAAARSATRERMVRALETRFSHWRAAGRIAAIDPGIGAQLVFALTESALRACFVDGAGRDRARWVRETTRAVQRYLGVGADQASSARRLSSSEPRR